MAEQELRGGTLVTRNPSHQNKQRGHLEEYNRAIKRQRYEPTIDQSLDFRETSAPGVDLTEPVPQKRRVVDVRAQIEAYIKEHWIAWVVGIVCVAFVFLLVDAKVDFARLFSRAEEHERQIERIEHSVERANEKNVEQDLSIQANEIRLDNLERNRREQETRGQ